MRSSKVGFEIIYLLCLEILATEVFHIFSSTTISHPMTLLHHLTSPLCPSVSTLVCFPFSSTNSSLASMSYTANPWPLSSFRLFFHLPKSAKSSHICCHCFLTSLSPLTTCTMLSIVFYQSVEIALFPRFQESYKSLSPSSSTKPKHRNHEENDSKPYHNKTV